MTIAALFANDFLYLMPEIFATLAVIVLIVYGVVYTTSSQYKHPLLARNMVYLSIFVLFLELLVLHNHTYLDKVILHNTLIVDYFSIVIKMIVVIAAIIALWLSIEYIRVEKLNAFEYGIIILLSTIGMTLIVSSYDLISMYLAIEFQSLCLYVLAAFKRESQFSTESGLKYFILGAFSSGILLFGASLLYGFTGMTNFEDLAKLFMGFGTDSNYVINQSGTMIGLLLVAVGLLFKIYAVPFHVWVPDVYEGSPTIVTAFFALTPSISVMAVFLRLFMSTFYDFVEGWQPVLIYCSIASMALASIAALSQLKIKRLIAYSAIGHAGYLLIGFAAATPDGVRGLLLYSVVYIIMTAGMFSFILGTRTKFTNTQIKYLSDLNILFKTNPLLALTVALILFSLAGIPPLAGFFSKLYVFFAAIKMSLYFVVFVGVVTSVIGSFYYLRLIQIMYFEKPKHMITYTEIDSSKALIMAVSTFILLFFFVYPSPLMILTHKAALLLCL